MKLFNQIQLFALALSTTGTLLTNVQPSQAASLSISGLSCTSSIVVGETGNTTACSDPFSIDTQSLIRNFDVAIDPTLANPIAESQTDLFLSEDNGFSPIRTNEPSMTSSGLSLLFFSLPVGMMLISKKPQV